MSAPLSVLAGPSLLHVRGRGHDRAFWAWERFAEDSVWAAVLAVCVAGGIAVAGVSYAAVPDAHGVIHGCYSTTNGALSVLNHEKDGCPAGTRAVSWNQTGQPGPAGVSVGLSAASGTSVALNAKQSLAPVLTASPAPQDGTYFVNPSVMLIVGQGDTVACILAVNGGATGDFATVGPVANQTYETLPLTATVRVSAGDSLQAECSGYTGNTATAFYDGAMTATLIGDASGNSKGSPHAPAALPPKR